MGAMAFMAPMRYSCDEERTVPYAAYPVLCPRRKA